MLPIKINKNKSCNLKLLKNKLLKCGKNLNLKSELIKNLSRKISVTYRISYFEGEKTVKRISKEGYI